MNDKLSTWSKYIPWYLTIACSVSLILVSFYLYQNVEWFKSSAVDNSDLMKDGQYRVFFYTSYLSFIKRSLGIITGIAISFIGLAVSFFEMTKVNKVELKGFARLASYSVGLIAIFLGVFLVIRCIDSKDSIKFDNKQKTEKDDK